MEKIQKGRLSDMVWIENVHLETGYHEKKPNHIVTTTRLAALEIEDGKIKTIAQTAPKESENTIDAEGYLALPSLKDNHVHLDKGHFGGEWQAVIPATDVPERIEEEKRFLRDYLPETPKKAQALIDLICGQGVTSLRVHVNVDPTIEMENVRIIQEVLEKNKHKLNYELVAFPQHGTLYTESHGLLSKAAEDTRIKVIGGLDPATIDVDVEKSLQVTFEIAVRNDLGVDIHLHDHGTLGINEIKRIIEFTKNYDMQGRVQISHAFSLADISQEELLPVVEKLAKQKIAINTTVPIDIIAIPIPFLQKHGVTVHVVNDNIHDHWSPFGTGDMIERASRAAEVFSMTDEMSLAQAYGLISGGVTALDTDGKQQWPKPGDDANLLFVKADSSAHLVARVCPERVVMFQGTIVSGDFK